MEVAVADPIPAFIERVTHVERTTVLGRSEAEAVVTAGLTDDQIQAVIDTLLASPLTMEQAIDMVKRPMYRRGQIGLNATLQKRPAYASKLLTTFNGVKRHKRAPAPRRRKRA